MKEIQQPGGQSRGPVPSGCQDSLTRLRLSTILRKKGAKRARAVRSVCE